MRQRSRQRRRPGPGRGRRGDRRRRGPVAGRMLVVCDQLVDAPGGRRAHPPRPPALGERSPRRCRRDGRPLRELGHGPRRVRPRVLSAAVGTDRRKSSVQPCGRASFVEIITAKAWLRLGQWPSSERQWCQDGQTVVHRRRSSEQVRRPSFASSGSSTSRQRPAGPDGRRAAGAPVTKLVSTCASCPFSMQQGWRRSSSSRFPSPRAAVRPWRSGRAAAGVILHDPIALGRDADLDRERIDGRARAQRRKTARPDTGARWRRVSAPALASAFVALARAVVTPIHDGAVCREMGTQSPAPPAVHPRRNDGCRGSHSRPPARASRGVARHCVPDGFRDPGLG